MKAKIIDYIETIQEDDKNIDNLLNENYFDLIEKNWEEFISEFLIKITDLNLKNKIETAVLAGMILYKLYFENNRGDY